MLQIKTFKEFRLEHPEITDEREAEGRYWHSIFAKTQPYRNQSFQILSKDTLHFVYAKALNRLEPEKNGFTIYMTYDEISINISGLNNSYQKSGNYKYQCNLHIPVYRFIPEVLTNRAKRISYEIYYEAVELFYTIEDFYEHNK